MYFDRDACQCLMQSVCLFEECVDGMTLDPRYPCECSDVIEVEDLYANDECEVKECPAKEEDESMKNYDCVNGKKVCRGSQKCEFGYWNSRACMCFSEI